VIGEPGEPFTTYTISVADMASIFPTPDTWVAKSKQTILGYNDPWEMLAEKFHCTRDYIRYLNRDVKEVAVGTVVIGPKVSPAAKIQKIAKVRIILDEATIQGLDASGRIVAHFPCSIARDKHKRPSGELTVKNVVPNPDYTFSPEVQVEPCRAGLGRLEPAGLWHAWHPRSGSHFQNSILGLFPLGQLECRKAFENGFGRHSCDGGASG
jgi:lipoprotein-anchoring transpeptidase ErfK/SrfK